MWWSWSRRLIFSEICIRIIGGSLHLLETRHEHLYIWIASYKQSRCKAVGLGGHNLLFSFCNLPRCSLVSFIYYDWNVSLFENAIPGAPRRGPGGLSACATPGLHHKICCYYILVLLLDFRFGFRSISCCCYLILVLLNAGERRARATPGLRHKIPVFSDPDPGKS